MTTPALPFMESAIAAVGVRWRLRLRWGLACVPPTVTDQQKGARALPGGRIQFYTKARVAEGRRQWAAILAGARAGYGKPIPAPVPVRLSLALVYPWPKSAGKAERMWTVPLAHYPDADNILKGCLDVMKGVFFEDDAQVASVRVSKWRGPDSGVALCVWEGTKA